MGTALMQGMAMTIRANIPTNELIFDGQKTPRSGRENDWDVSGVSQILKRPDSQISLPHSFRPPALHLCVCAHHVPIAA